MFSTDRASDFVQLHYRNVDIAADGHELRLTGTYQDIELLIPAMHKIFHVVSVSDSYDNGDGQTCRVYLRFAGLKLLCLPACGPS
ncbi:MAG TPA: hypothetical protein VMT34_13555 [Aggregatilineales bacterium]|nr:hypothetical protein [Aggregatilineales bacterium]